MLADRAPVARNAHALEELMIQQHYSFLDLLYLSQEIGALCQTLEQNNVPLDSLAEMIRYFTERMHHHGEANLQALNLIALTRKPAGG